MDDPDKAEAIEAADSTPISGSRALDTVPDESGRVLAARPDGLVREVIGKQVISREEVNELTETEERKALGDFSDEVSTERIGSRFAVRGAPASHGSAVKTRKILFINSRRNHKNYAACWW